MEEKKKGFMYVNCEKHIQGHSLDSLVWFVVVSTNEFDSLDLDHGLDI